MLRLPSGSDAFITPIEVWFSITVNVLFDVNIGALSFKLIRLIVIFWLVSNVPSFAITVR